MQTANLAHVSTGEPTHWPSDRRKMPYLIGFAVVRKIPAHTHRAQSSSDLSSDHSPLLITLHSRFVPKLRVPTLSTKQTNWSTYRTLIQETLTLQVNIKNCARHWWLRATTCPNDTTSSLELNSTPSHLHTHVHMCPADKTENHGEEETAQKMAKHQITTK